MIDSDRYLALQTFDQMADCHPGWDGVRIDDDVWCDALTGERHVLGHVTHNIRINLRSETMDQMIRSLFTSCLYWIPQVPFWPCRLANLSPI